MSETIAKLRELLTRERTIEVFGEILALLPSFADSSEEETAFSYAQTHLNDWEDGLRHAALKDCWPGFPGDAPLPGYFLVRSLDASGLSKANVGYLLESTHLAQIRHLDLFSCSLNAASMKLLCESKNVAQLTQLNLASNKIEHSGAEVLAQASNMPGLRQLNLGFNELLCEGTAAIANSAHMANLTHLNLEQNHLEEVGTIALANSPHMARLTHLNLNCNNIGDAGVEAIANSLHMSQLRELDLGFVRTNEVWRIGCSPHIKQLEALNLKSVNLGWVGLENMADAENLASLKKLNLSGNKGIGDKGVAVLAKAPHLTHLESLDISDCGITAKGIATLSKARNFSSLTYLNLYSNRIGDEGLKALANSKHITQLQELNLVACGFEEEGASALANSTNISHLKRLYMPASNNPSKVMAAFCSSQKIPIEARQALLGFLKKGELLRIAKELDAVPSKTKTKTMTSDELKALILGV